jgi:dUTP pyrophosphatase
MLKNGGAKSVVIPRGDRIAQLVFQRFLTPDVVEVSELSATERGEDGFGSTGLD